MWYILYDTLILPGNPSANRTFDFFKFIKLFTLWVNLTQTAEYFATFNFAKLLSNCRLLKSHMWYIQRFVFLIKVWSHFWAWNVIKMCRNVCKIWQKSFISPKVAHTTIILHWHGKISIYFFSATEHQAVTALTAM